MTQEDQIQHRFEPLSHEGRLVRDLASTATRRHRGASFGTLLAFCALALPAQATVPLDGVLVATRDCPATVSIKQRDPAGGVRLEPGRGYRLLGKNRAEATHYQVVIEGAKPPERWVEVSCGSLVGGHSGEAGDTGAEAAPRTTVEGAAPPATPAAEPTTGPAGQTHNAPARAAEPATGAATGAKGRAARSRPGAFVLALSWQPAFCEINRRKGECRDQTAQRLDASRFSLHGLWPQPRENAYCGVDARNRRLDQDGAWTALPSPELSAATRERLATLMPGARSGLDRHEWINHGTCYGTDADSYFSHAMGLTDQVNAGPVRVLFAEHRGRHLSSTQVRAAFDAAFGRGAGERVRLVCEEGMISELRLSLKGEIAEDSRIGPLLQAAVPLSPRCRGGRVDEAGFE